MHWGESRQADGGDRDADGATRQHRPPSPSLHGLALTSTRRVRAHSGCSAAAPVGGQAEGRRGETIARVSRSIQHRAPMGSAESERACARRGGEPEQVESESFNVYVVVRACVLTAMQAARRAGKEFYAVGAEAWAGAIDICSSESSSMESIDSNTGGSVVAAEEATAVEGGRKDGGGAAAATAGADSGAAAGGIAGCSIGAAGGAPPEGTGTAAKRLDMSR
jgi:hypothetical protein